MSDAHIWNTPHTHSECFHTLLYVRHIVRAVFDRSKWNAHSCTLIRAFDASLVLRYGLLSIQAYTTSRPPVAHCDVMRTNV